MYYVIVLLLSHPGQVVATDVAQSNGHRVVLLLETELLQDQPRDLSTIFNICRPSAKKFR